MTTIVFLHIPKTAGQTVFHEISRVVGADRTSPIRLHSQAKGETQFPPGYDFYSGHIDWTDLENVGDDRFVFTVLRDPKERIASFYLYMLKRSEALRERDLELKQNTGLKMIRTRSADDYFFSGDPKWQRFIHDHYDNVFCTYFATRRMRGWNQIRGLKRPDLLTQAVAGSKAIDRIYMTDKLADLESDIERLTGQSIDLIGNYKNAGPKPQASNRWDQLAQRFESDRSLEKLERFARLDQRLLKRLGL